MKLKKLLMCFVAAAGLALSGCSGESAWNQKAFDAAKEISHTNMQDVSPQKGDITASFEVEGYGTIKAVLFADIAPVGVENFWKLCESGFYKGLKIHRVMKDFMFQGGSLNGSSAGDTGEALVNGGSFGTETSDNARHFYGALCYANAAGQNTTQFYIVNNNQENVIENTISSYEKTKAELEELAEQYAAAGSADGEEYYKSYAELYQQETDKLKAMDEDLRERYNQKGGTYSLDGGYTVFGQVYEGFEVIDAISNVAVESNESGEMSKPETDIIIKNVTISIFN